MSSRGQSVQCKARAHIPAIGASSCAIANHSASVSLAQCVQRPLVAGLTTFAKATVVRRSFTRRRKPRPTYVIQLFPGPESGIHSRRAIRMPRNDDSRYAMKSSRLSRTISGAATASVET